MNKMNDSFRRVLMIRARKRFKCGLKKIVICNKKKYVKKWEFSRNAGLSRVKWRERRLRLRNEKWKEMIEY